MERFNWPSCLNDCPCDESAKGKCAEPYVMVRRSSPCSFTIEYVQLKLHEHPLRVPQAALLSFFLSCFLCGDPNWGVSAGLPIQEHFLKGTWDWTVVFETPLPAIAPTRVNFRGL